MMWSKNSRLDTLRHCTALRWRWTQSLARVSVRSSSLLHIALGRMSCSIRAQVSVQAPGAGIDDRIICTRASLIRVDIRTVRENAVDAGGVIHREIETSDGAVTPANDCYFGNA